MEFALQEWQIILVGFAATILVQIVRFVAAKFEKPVSKVAIQWIVFAVSLALGLWWGSFELPAFPGFGGPEALEGVVGFIGAIVTLVGQLLGVAYVVYNVLLKKVFDAIEPLRL
jgi:hypothetical protein